MDYLISLLLVLPCARASAYASGVPTQVGLGRLIQLRRNAYPVYASDSSGEEYEPYAVAALPLHAPVPILQVYSPSAYRNKLRRPTKRHRPEPTDLYAFSSQIEQAYEPVEYEYVYASSEESQPGYQKYGSFNKARDQYEDETASVATYARPNRPSGFSYRKPQAPTRATSPAPVRPREPQEPVIIRIHKYRVVH